MTIGPFDIGLAIDRLKAQVPVLKLVQGAAELATAVQAGGAPQTPCAYVLLAAELPRGPAYGTSEAHVQTIDCTLNVVLALRNYAAGQLGAQVKDDLRSLLQSVRGALVGWPPLGNAGQGSSFDFGGGKLHDYTNATVWWVEVYKFNYFERVI